MFSYGLCVARLGWSPGCGESDESIFGGVGFGCTRLQRAVFGCRVHPAAITKKTTEGTTQGRLEAGDLGSDQLRHSLLCGLGMLLTHPVPQFSHLQSKDSDSTSLTELSGGRNEFTQAKDLGQRGHKVSVGGR